MSSLFDALKKQILGSIGFPSNPSGSAAPADHAAVPGLLDQLLAMVQGNGLAEMMKRFESLGLKDIFASWVSKGANLPISPEQITAALGGDKLKEIAAKLGIGEGQAASLLAQVFPEAVDRLTPDGTLPEPEAPAASSGATDF